MFDTGRPWHQSPRPAGNRMRAQAAGTSLHGRARSSAATTANAIERTASGLLPHSPTPETLRAKPEISGTVQRLGTDSRRERPSASALTHPQPRLAPRPPAYGPWTSIALPVRPIISNAEHLAVLRRRLAAL